jgi:hypothetical protein
MLPRVSNSEALLNHLQLYIHMSLFIDKDNAP